MTFQTSGLKPAFAIEIQKASVKAWTGDGNQCFYLFIYLIFLFNTILPVFTK